jgi:hypothetical protein
MLMEECLLIKIKVDNNIVRNDKISSSAFSLYVELKYLSFLNKNSNEISIHHKLLMKYLNWNDIRKLKTYLIELYNFKLIKEEFKTLPKYKPIKITLINYTTKNFTWLPDNLIKNIRIIGDTGLRLIYYYKSFINDKDINLKYAYPSKDIISNNLGISENTVTKYNRILQKNKLIKIDKHESMGKNKNSNTGKYFTKFNNYYYINLEKILNF